MLEPLCNLTVNLAGDRGQNSLLQFNTETEYSPSKYLKHKKEYKNKYASLNNSHRNHTNRIFYQEIFKSINQSLHPNCNTCHEFILPLWGFLCIRDTD